jgi:hypothetical protein
MRVHPVPPQGPPETWRRAVDDRPALGDLARRPLGPPVTGWRLALFLVLAIAAVGVLLAGFWSQL